MSILVEAISVVFRNERANEMIKGGVGAIKSNPPNATFRTDGLLSAVSFMDPNSARQFVERLERVGFEFIRNGTAIDIAVVDQHRGCTTACDWLKFEAGVDAPSECWLVGREKGDMVPYDTWVPGNELTFSDADAAEELKFVRTENQLDVFLNLRTGKEIFRPRSEVDIVQRSKNSWVFSLALKMIFDQLQAEGWNSLSINAAADQDNHMILRYRNQLSLVLLELEWEDAQLSVLSTEKRKKLIEAARSLNAIPVVASLRAEGELPDAAKNIRDVIEANCLSFASKKEILFLNLYTDSELSLDELDFEESIPLSSWEIHNFGIQVVSNYLTEQGYQIEHSNSDMGTAPNIVASIDGKTTNILVDTASFPKRHNHFEEELCRNLAAFSAEKGHEFKLAAVSLASPDDPFDPVNPLQVALNRGQKALVKFDGLSDPVFATNS